MKRGSSVTIRSSTLPGVIREGPRVAEERAREARAQVEAARNGRHDFPIHARRPRSYRPCAALGEVADTGRHAPRRPRRHPRRCVRGSPRSRRQARAPALAWATKGAPPMRRDPSSRTSTGTRAHARASPRPRGDHSARSHRAGHRADERRLARGPRSSSGIVLHSTRSAGKSHVRHRAPVAPSARSISSPTFPFVNTRAPPSCIPDLGQRLDEQPESACARAITARLSFARRCHHAAPDGTPRPNAGRECPMACARACGVRTPPRRHRARRVRARGRSEVAELARWAASRHLPCVEMGDADLDRHAGVHPPRGAVRRRAPALLDVDARARRHPCTLAWRRDRARRVRNPYNVGAVLRSAAFFGLEAALLGTPAPHPGLAPTAVRVAEGGAEHLGLARTTDLAAPFARLRTRGVRVVGTERPGDGERVRPCLRSPCCARHGQ